MNIREIRRTLIDQGILAEVMEQFVFPETEGETPEQKTAFARQMDRLLTREQILSVMAEQGCGKNEPSEELMEKLRGKTVRERMEVLNAMGISESARSRINDDGTLSIFWDFQEDGKYRCVCPIIGELEKPADVSITYCGCCSGHVKYHFENNLGVKLRLVETVSSPISSGGEKYCEHRFEIVKDETLGEVSRETMRFMRGKYALDEVGNGKDELKFRRGGKTVLTIYIREERYDFLLIFGKAERETFEARREDFPKWIREIYDGSKTYHDGKWMVFPVKDSKSLEAVKELIFIKKKPNRKPFSKEGAIYSDCGHRCDLCVHYRGNWMEKEPLDELKARLGRVYDPGGSGYWGEDMRLCDSCPKGGYDGADNPCVQKKCAADHGADHCTSCGEYPCNKATAGYPPKIEPRSILAEDVTWAILPYVEGQYGN